MDKDNDRIGDLEKKLKALDAKVTLLQARVAALDEEIKALQGRQAAWNAIEGGARQP